MKEFLSCASSFLKAKVLMFLEEGGSGEEEVVEEWSRVCIEMASNPIPGNMKVQSRLQSQYFPLPFSPDGPMR